MSVLFWDVGVQDLIVLSAAFSRKTAKVVLPELQENVLLGRLVICSIRGDLKDADGKFRGVKQFRYDGLVSRRVCVFTVMMFNLI